MKCCDNTSFMVDRQYIGCYRLMQFFTPLRYLLNLTKSPRIAATAEGPSHGKYSRTRVNRPFQYARRSHQTNATGAHRRKTVVGRPGLFATRAWHADRSARLRQPLVTDGRRERC